MHHFMQKRYQLQMIREKNFLLEDISVQREKYLQFNFHPVFV